MTLIPRRAIYYSGGWNYYFDPRGLVVPAPRPLSIVRNNEIPFYSAGGSGFQTTYSKQHGWEISISGILHASTLVDGLDAKADLLDALVDSSGDFRTVSFSYYVDTAESKKWIFRDCIASELPQFGDGQKRCSFSLTLISRDPNRYANAADGSIPGAGPYEDYLLNGTEAASVSHATKYMIPVTFDGELEVTDSDNVSWMQKRIRLDATQAFNIKSIQLLGLQRAGASDTTIIVSDSAYSGHATANYLSLTISGGSATATPVSGTVAISGGSYLYVYCTAAGGHAGITANIGVESA